MCVVLVSNSVDFSPCLSVLKFLLGVAYFKNWLRNFSAPTFATIFLYFRSIGLDIWLFLFLDKITLGNMREGKIWKMLPMPLASSGTQLHCGKMLRSLSTFWRKVDLLSNTRNVRTSRTKKPQVNPIAHCNFISRSSWDGQNFPAELSPNCNSQNHKLIINYYFFKPLN